MGAPPPILMSTAGWQSAAMKGWEDIESAGKRLQSADEIVPASDGTLTVNGERVIFHIQDVYVGTRPKYHVTDCSTLDGMRTAGRFFRYVVSQRTDGKFVLNYGTPDYPEHDEVTLAVCKNCLSAIDWDGYNTLPYYQRDQAVRGFSPKAFFEVYEKRPPGVMLTKQQVYNRDKSKYRYMPKPEPEVANKPVVFKTGIPQHHQAAIDHIRLHGSLSESEAGNILGGARHIRRFSREIIDINKGLEFNIRVVSTPAGKRFEKR